MNYYFILNFTCLLLEIALTHFSRSAEPLRGQLWFDLLENVKIPVIGTGSGGINGTAGRHGVDAHATLGPLHGKALKYCAHGGKIIIIIWLFMYSQGGVQKMEPSYNIYVNDI